MSLRWRDRRAKLFSGDTPPPKRATRRAPVRSTRRARKTLRWAPLFAVAVVALLSLAFLRISILRTRYALGETLQQETELRTRERTAAVDVRVARDPHRLREQAAEQGFVRPERVIDLSQPVTLARRRAEHPDEATPVDAR